MGAILITGVTGFCARHLIERLRLGGRREIYGVDIHPFPQAMIPILRYKRIDVNDFTSLCATVKAIQPEAVFHLAGLNKGPLREMFQVNCLGTVNLLEALHRVSPHSRVLIVGSAAEYGPVGPENLPVEETSPCRPVSAYGASKMAMTLAAEEYFRQYQLRVVIARPFNIVGAGVPPSLVIGAVLDRIRLALENGRDPVHIAVGNLDSRRDFIAVEDVVEAYIQLIEGEFWGEVFNLCSGEPRSIENILHILLSYCDRPITLEVDPGLVQSAEVRQMYGNPAKARRTFGFKPNIPLERALKAAWDQVMTESLQDR
jgi:GDP-4-dehydro-6-deoxy-D-mannose reductase